MSAPRETAAFALVLTGLLAAFFGESLFGGKVLSPGDVVLASASFRGAGGPDDDYEPANRLLIDPVLQFQPWLEFNRAMFRRGRLPLWNDAAGLGAPHLANSQSAPFDPFHLIAYCGTLPDAYARMALARLWVAGVGMFWLARSWGLDGWGRWFAGLTYPFCGFLVVWLLFPVTNVAIWMPWLFLATDSALERRSSRSVGLLALAAGCVFLGGHVQTSAYVLLAAGLYAAWRIGRDWEGPRIGSISAWGAGIVLGLAIASISIVPLWVYLGKSPVWTDRDQARPSVFALSKPRILDAICTKIPYAFGSQRRGHPNLARALGVHNLNESAGGFAGLATLIWLAPMAWCMRREVRRVEFLAGLGSVGFLGGFEFPPVVNLLRVAPVLNVTDQRRLVMWLAFALVLLGGIGLDNLHSRFSRATERWWVSLWVAGAATLALLAVSIARAEPLFAERARAHYRHAAEATEGAHAGAYQLRAERQTRLAVTFLPRVLGLASLELCALAGLAVLYRGGIVGSAPARSLLLALTLGELFAFGYGLNPAIERARDRPDSAVIRRIREKLGPGGRLLGVGEELPPNMAMRYGLADPRNYDSVEMSRNLDWFEPLYEPDGRGRTSRRTIRWEGVVRALDRLEEAGVGAVVGASAPPPELNRRVERSGNVWVVWLRPSPIIASVSGAEPTASRIDNGKIELTIECSHDDRILVRQIFDEGWRATVDGRPAAPRPHLGTFLSLNVGAGRHRVTLAYEPAEVREAGIASLSALSLAVFLLTGFRPFRSTRILREGLGAVRAVGLESDS